MEYLKTYYSLERHLEETVKFNPQFEVLNSIWKLNKKNLSSALNNINQYYPHYSLHDRSHSTTIINNIELFLGEERIKRLSPTNTWLILMASFTHDLGMVIFQDVIEREWKSSDFQDFLFELCNWDDKDLNKSGLVLLALQNIKSGSLDNFEYSPIEIKNAVTLVVAEYMRRVHHKRSSDILKGIDKTFHDVANAFYSDQIPNRLLSVLGDIAFLHGVEFYEIFNRLDFESNGISNDKINPRFVAAMLRLGDLLDIDDGRFNPFTINVFKSPDSSALHQKKHSSIKHLLINPDAIEITADCSEEEVYRLARSWFDWLEVEVENLNKEWSKIAPNDLGGSAPRIPKGKIKVGLNNSILDEKFLSLKFQVSNQKIFEILEGGSIYDKAEFTFLRELVQNALDASKIQLWVEITRGTYDFAFRKQFNDQNLTHAEIIKKINFPDDIPIEICNSYRIDLNVFWENVSRENLIIEVVDQGTGISERDLLRMTSKVGESRKGNNIFKEFLNTMPFWLRPTGAFGVGLQSLFIITDSFQVTTKFEGEIGKKIDFRSSKKNKYSTVSEEALLNKRGTKVTVCVAANRFPEIFGTSFDWDIITNYDHFNDDFGNIYIHKIWQYIRKELFRVDTLFVRLLDKTIDNQVKKDYLSPLFPKPLEDTEISVNVYIRNKSLIFQFFENIIGSEFVLDFFSDDNTDIQHNWTFYQIDFFVRDMPVKSNIISYYVLSYCKLTWNFMSPESDKILSLTREKFIAKYKSQIDKKFQTEVLKKALSMAVSFLEGDRLSKIKESFKDSMNDLSMIYFKFLLTLRANQIPISNYDSDLLATKLNNAFASYINNDVTYNDFLNTNTLVVPFVNIRETYGNNQKLLKEKLIAEIVDLSSSSIVVWSHEFFSLYLRMNYHIKEIKYYGDGYIMMLASGTADADNIIITGDVSIYLMSFVKHTSLSERVWHYNANKYSSKLSVYNEYGSGFEHFPYLSNTSIISPFRNIKQFEALYAELDSLDAISEDKIKKSLTDSLIKKHVTQSLIEWILKFRPSKNDGLTENEIVEGYRDLIADMLLAKKKNEISGNI